MVLLISMKNLQGFWFGYPVELLVQKSQTSLCNDTAKWCVKSILGFMQKAKGPLASLELFYFICRGWTDFSSSCVFLILGIVVWVGSAFNCTSEQISTHLESRSPILAVIICKNSSKSMVPEPSLSMSAIIFLISSFLGSKPRALSTNTVQSNYSNTDHTPQSWK